MLKPQAYVKILYLVFFLFLSAWAVFQPQYTWDLVGYIGSSVDSTDPVVIHDTAFNAIRGISSPDMQVDNPYRVDVAANPFHFTEQLPFYSIKPVYVLLVKAVHRAGMSFPRSTVAVSAGSNFLLAVLLWVWLSRYLSAWACAAACSLIMLSPNILALSRWPTPDCLATLIAATGLYLILERSAYFWGSSLLVIDVWTRTDALILAGIVFALLLVLRKLDVAQFACLCILALGSYFAINHFAGSYNWSTLFYNSFLGGVPAPGEMIIHLSRSAYLHQVIRGSFLWLIYGSFALYLLLGGLAIWMNRASLYSYAIAAVISARALSYFLYPNGDQRYTAVLYVVILVALVIAVRLSTQNRSSSILEQQTSEPLRVRPSSLPLESAAATQALR
jgi:hypothetical protein